MDRTWMKASHISDVYENGVEEFLQFVQQNTPVMGGKYFCPCVKCTNGRRQTLNDIRSHLICDDIIPNYKKRIWHGQLADTTTLPHTQVIDVHIKDRIKDMIPDLGQEGFRQANAPYYDNLQSDSKKPLYSGCTTFTRLSAVLALVILKAGFG